MAIQTIALAAAGQLHILDNMTFHDIKIHATTGASFNVLVNHNVFRLLVIVNSKFSAVVTR
jgi:hypothetical protein